MRAACSFSTKREPVDMLPTSPVISQARTLGTIKLRSKSKSEPFYGLGEVSSVVVVLGLVESNFESISDLESTLFWSSLGSLCVSAPTLSCLGGLVSFLGGLASLALVASVDRFGSTFRKFCGSLCKFELVPEDCC